jgi:hypothetical protein
MRVYEVVQMGVPPLWRIILSGLDEMLNVGGIESLDLIESLSTRATTRTSPL